MKNIFTKKLNWWQGLLFVLIVIFIAQFLISKFIISNLQESEKIQDDSQLETMSEVIIEEDVQLNSEDTFSEADIISFVDEIKTKVSLPDQLDEFTLLKDITAEPNSIRYHYIINDTVMELLDDSFTNSYVLEYCEDPVAKEFLDLGIIMEYSFTSESSNKKHLISITKEDCL